MSQIGLNRDPEKDFNIILPLQNICLNLFRIHNMIKVVKRLPVRKIKMVEVCRG